MQRHYKWITAMVLSLSVLAGCGTSSSTNNSQPAPAPAAPQPKEVTITFAQGKDTGPTTQKLLDAFAAKYPNIKVKYTELPPSTDAQHDDYVTKLSAGDTSVDVFAMDIIWPPEFGAAKWTLPLDSYFPQSEQDTFLPGPLAGNKWGGKLYSIPWYTDAGLFYYRKDILDKYGKQPPKTWDDVIALSKELVGKDGIEMGMVFQGNQYEGLVCDILEFMRGNGGDVLDANNKVIVDSPNNAAAIKFLRTMIEQKLSPAGVTTYQETESNNAFLEGKALFLRNWPYAWAAAQTAPESKIKDKVGVEAVPMGPNGKNSSATLGGWNLGINANIPADRKEAAVTFVKFMTGEEAQKIGALVGGRLPTRKALYSDADILKVNPHWKEFYNAFITASARPITPAYPKVSDAIQINVHKAITGTITPEEAVKNMQDAISKVIK